MSRITTIEELEAIYDPPGESSTAKEINWIPEKNQRQSNQAHLAIGPKKGKPEAR